jgi:hypothetical protein
VGGSKNRLEWWSSVAMAQPMFLWKMAILFQIKFLKFWKYFMT